MTNEELKQAITALLPTAVFDETGEFLNVQIDSTDSLPLLKHFRSDPSFNFDHLFCLTCVDRPDHMVIVYHLFSREWKHTLVLKAKINTRENPEIETVSHIWRTAELLEREVFDLFGVKFLHHPDLRRLIMDDDWNGFPLRKDYVDENMIEL